MKIFNGILGVIGVIVFAAMAATMFSMGNVLAGILNLLVVVFIIAAIVIVELPSKDWE